MSKCDSSTLLSIGEAMAEIRSGLTDGFSLGFAGDTYNTAVYASRAIGQRGLVSYATRVGADPLSLCYCDAAQREGIDISGIAKDPNHNIGIYSVSTDDSGERSFHYWRSNSAARRMFASDETTPDLPAARVIYLSGITMAILTPDARTRLIDTLTSKRAQEGAKIAFDSNYRPALWDDPATARAVMDRMWKITDIALPSIDDEMALLGEGTEEAVIDRFSERSWEGIAIKRGSRGPISPNICLGKHPEFKPAANVVDTTAAGDSFNGAYLAAYLSGADEVKRLLAGHSLAAKVIGFPGAIIPGETQSKAM